MKRHIVIFFFIILASNVALAQINKDIDGDGIKDDVYLDSLDYKIVCKLSTKKFIPIYSKSELTDELNAGVRETKSGFEFYVNYMRGGNASQFRYDTKTKKIQLIGMSRYEFGPASNDGSGNSSVNLITNTYIGEWNYYNIEKEKLIKLPTLKTKMYIVKQYLEDFDGSSVAIFIEKCSELYSKYKAKYYR